VEFQQTLEPGQAIDRYGSLYGSFLAPFATPYAARSIPPSSLDDSPGFTCNYHTYKVLKAFTVEAGPIAPAFGQPGLGLQYQLVSSLLPGDPSTANVYWLVDNGYLAATNGQAPSETLAHSGYLVSGPGAYRGGSPSGVESLR
jgi:Tuberculosis necrotizing toxin